MSVLIKGMEMPLPGTFNIIYIYSDGQVHMPSWGKGMTPTNGVKAIPVPPHGRLGDLDALDMQLSFIAEAEEQIYGRGNWRFAEKCRSKVHEAPTIIPASVEAE